MIARSSGLIKRSYQITTSVCMLAFAASLTACGGGSTDTATQTPGATGTEGTATPTESASAPMEKPPLTGQVALTGAGAFFPRSFISELVRATQSRSSRSSSELSIRR